MQPWSTELHGHYDEITFESNVLQDNPLRDAYRRPLWVYLPPGYNDDANRRYPTVYQIQGLTGQLDIWCNRTAFRKTFPELADGLCAQRDALACIVLCCQCCGT